MEAELCGLFFRGTDGRFSVCEGETPVLSGEDVREGWAAFCALAELRGLKQLEGERDVRYQELIDRNPAFHRLVERMLTLLEIGWAPWELLPDADAWIEKKVCREDWAAAREKLRQLCKIYEEEETE